MYVCMYVCMHVSHNKEIEGGSCGHRYETKIQAVVMNIRGRTLYSFVCNYRGVD